MRLSMTRRLCALSAGTALIGGAVIASLSSGASPADATTTSPIPKYDHVVLAIFENHTQAEMTQSAPYLTKLAKSGVTFSNSYAVDHPSEPNYLALFSGSVHGMSGFDDSCPDGFTGDNLGHQLITAGKTFVSYAEDLPANPWDPNTGCSQGSYVPRHVPAVEFSDLNGTGAFSPSVVAKDFSAFPEPTTATPSPDYSNLPTFSFVTPNMCDDMHSCSIATGDTWSQNNLDSYATWAKTHNSLLIVTTDEDDDAGASSPSLTDAGGNALTTTGGHIMTFFVGANITPGTTDSSPIDHYNVLRTIEDMYGLPHLGQAANRAPITDAWSTTPAPSPSPGPSPAPAGTLVSGGVYAIGTSGANEYLDDLNSSTTAGARLVLWNGTAATNHRWTAKDAGNGYYTFVNVASGQCLGNTGSLNAGASIVQNPCNGAVSQSWKLIATTGGYKLVNKYSGLVVTPSGTTDGSYLTQQAGSQAWTFTKVG